MQMSIPLEINTVVINDRFSCDTKKNNWSRWCKHKFWVLEFEMAQGVQVQVIEGIKISTPFEWKPVTWNLYSPGTAYRVKRENPHMKHLCIWITFALKNQNLTFMKKGLTVILDRQEYLENQIRQMFKLQEEGDLGYRLLMQSLFLEILGFFQKVSSEIHQGTPQEPWILKGNKDHFPKKKKDILLSQIDNLIIKRLKVPPTLDQLAESLYLSISSLSHKLKAESGWTVMSRVRWLRIRESKKLLSESDLSIKEVSHKLGFKNPYYFSRVFTEITGMSPLQYKRFKN